MKALAKYLVFIFLLSTFSYGQNNFEKNVSKRGTVAAPFLNISQGARATAMGSAFVAVADDPTAVFWNPAGVARLRQNGFAVDHTQWIADLKYNFIAGSINLGRLGAI